MSSDTIGSDGIVLFRIPALQRFLLLTGLALALAFTFATQVAPHSTNAQLPIAGGTTPTFQRGTLDFDIETPATLAFGPDGRLYVGGANSIWALTLDPNTQDVLATESIATGLDAVLGIAFDPSAPSPVKVYASIQEFTGTTPAYTGMVATFTAPNWPRQDIITNLPSSAPHTNHMTNGLAFGPDGRLYIAQGSNTDSGISGPNWPETPLSAAILVADVHDAGFDGVLTYSPSGTPTNDNVNLVSGDVAVYASGTRNPFDLVWHSNGHLYATDNGAMGQATSLTCSTQGGQTSTSDELNLIEEGNYYGAPNRNRGRFDARQCVYHSPQSGSGADYTGPIAILASHCSCDGILEYTSDAFGGALQGDLIYAGWARNYIQRTILAQDGRSVVSTSTLDLNFSSPLDVAEGPDGTIYVAEYGADRIAFLAPDSDDDGCADGRELGPDAEAGGQRDPNNEFDFYDINGDGLVSSPDVSAVVQAFGPSSGPLYRTAKDRAAPAPGGQPWDLGPPDGVINFVDDVAGVLAQYGHACG